jgi:hypothetical protein
MKGVMIDGSFTAGTEKGSQKTEVQEEVVQTAIKDHACSCWRGDNLRSLPMCAADPLPWLRWCSRKTMSRQGVPCRLHHYRGASGRSVT